MSYLKVVFNERELTRLQELSFGNVQAIFSVKKLHHAAITVPHGQVILNYESLKVLYHTSTTWEKWCTHISRALTKIIIVH